MPTNRFYVTLVFLGEYYYTLSKCPLSGYVGLVVLDAGGARGRLAGDSRSLQVATRSP